MSSYFTDKVQVPSYNRCETKPRPPAVLLFLPPFLTTLINHQYYTVRRYRRRKFASFSFDEAETDKLSFTKKKRQMTRDVRATDWFDYGLKSAKHSQAVIAVRGKKCERANRLWHQSIKQFLDGLSSGNTARSTGDSQLNVQHAVRKRLPEQVCLKKTTKCGQWFCWCHVFREVIPGLQVRVPGCQKLQMTV